METDPITNQPIMATKQDIPSDQKDQMTIEKGFPYTQFLQSEEGKEFLNRQRGKILLRAEQLIREDPICQSILLILGEFGTKIAAASMAADRQINKALRMKSNKGMYD